MGRELETYARATPSITGISVIIRALSKGVLSRMEERSVVNIGVNARTTWWNCETCQREDRGIRRTNTHRNSDHV